METSGPAGELLPVQTGTWERVSREGRSVKSTDIRVGTALRQRYREKDSSERE